MILLFLIFGMSIGELMTFLGVIVSGLGAIVWINIKLAEYNLRLNQLENNEKSHEILTIETARILKETTLETARILKETTLETARILALQTEKRDDQLEKMDSKIDHIIDMMKK